MPPPFSQGPKSAETVALARGMGAWAVRGNHDDSALSFLSKLDRNVQQGESGMMMSAKGGGLMSGAAVEVLMFFWIPPPPQNRCGRDVGSETLLIPKP